MTTLRSFAVALATFARGRGALVAVLFLTAAAIEAAGLSVLIQVVHLAGQDAPVASSSSFGVLLAVYVGLVAARSVAGRWLVRLNQHLEAGFVANLRRQVYGALMEASWSFHARTRVADAIHTLTHEADRAGAAAYYLLQLASGAALAAVYLGCALWLSPGLTTVVVAGGGVMFLLARRSARSAVAMGQAASATTEGLYRAIAEHFAGMKTARSYGAEGRHAAAFDALTRSVADAGRDLVRVSSGVRQRLELLSVSLLAAVLYAARVPLQLPMADTLVLLYVFARLMPRLNDLLVQGTTLLGLLPAYDAMMQGAARARAAAEPRPAPDALPIRARREIRLHDLTVRYPDRDTPAVAGVSLTIPAGLTTAVVGPSGAGKSTLADVVMGLLPASNGRLSVDGRDVDAAGAGWRGQIGYVTQDTFLFHDTIRENLRWAAPDVTDRAIWDALDRADAAAFVRALPAGLDTVVGDRGVLVLGGERQRLALARALVRRPALLILDEATSALDADSEASVLAAIGRLHAALTILIITHRLSAVRGADAIHVVDRGRLVESGSWATLVGRDTRFRRMCEVQGVDLTPPGVPAWAHAAR